MLCWSNLNLPYDRSRSYRFKLLLFHGSVRYKPRMGRVDSGPSIQTKVWYLSLLSNKYMINNMTVVVYKGEGKIISHDWYIWKLGSCIALCIYCNTICNWWLDLALHLGILYGQRQMSAVGNYAIFSDHSLPFQFAFQLPLPWKCTSCGRRLSSKLQSTDKKKLKITPMMAAPQHILVIYFLREIHLAW